MPGIWRKAGDEWVPMKAEPAPSEGDLQSRIVNILGKDPRALPLAGQPELTVVGQYVGTGSGEADVIAVERGGRPVIIEAKLHKNREARRQMVAQTLEYAADLHRLSVEEFERDILGLGRSESQPKSLAEAIGEDDDENFYEDLAEHLACGSFRIVFLLDRAPDVLVKLVGYLETITEDRIIVDLVTATSYELGQEHIFQTQRIDPERGPEPPPAWASKSPGKRSWRGPWQDSGRRFRDWLDELDDAANVEILRKVLDWADGLMEEGVCRFESRVRGSQGRRALALKTLGKKQPALAVLDDEADTGKAQLFLDGPAIAERAPTSLPALSQIAGRDMHEFRGHADAITDELLGALADAFREAAGR